MAFDPDAYLATFKPTGVEPSVPVTQTTTGIPGGPADMVSRTGGNPTAKTRNDQDLLDLQAQIKRGGNATQMAAWQDALKVLQSRAGGVGGAPFVEPGKFDPDAYLASFKKPAAPAGPQKPLAPLTTDVPEWGRNNPQLYGIAGATKTVLSPILEGLGMAGGAILGAAGGPATSILGAGLGYGAASSLGKAADVALGNAPAETAGQAVARGTKDVLTGATMEVGGRAAAPILAKGAQMVGKGVGKVADLFSIPEQTAARIVRDAIGPDLPLVKNALAENPYGMTAGQASAGVNSPTWQALVDRAVKRDPRFLEALKTTQGRDAINALANVAGGATQVNSLASQGAAKTALNEQLIPTLKTELNAANIAGEKLPVLQGQADRMGAAAASKVEDVRRFTAAVPRAEALARTNLIERQLPVGAAKYTYLGELGVKAEQVAAQAADASLPFGEAARFSQAAADSLAAHGLKPLKADAVVSSIRTKLGNPEFAGNKDVSNSLNRVAQDIAEWTNQGGVIDAWALDAIRKNSVNAAIRDMYPAADAKVQKELAASVLNKVKPLIVDAIEGAGGTGYGKYLSDYAAGRQLISQQRLGAKGMELFKANPQKFVDLVEGNTPKEVEKIFGPGNYDLAKSMSADAMEKLQGVAKAVNRDTAVAGQVAAGQDALRNLLKKELSVWRLPSYLSVISSSTNKALDILERKIGDKTMTAIQEAAKSGRTMSQLIETLPFNERNRVTKLLSNPQEWGVPVTNVKGAAVNTLAPDRKNTNALTQP